MRLLKKIARRLPEPLILFALLALITIVLSAIAAALNLSAINPGDRSQIEAVSLLSGDGIRRIVSEAVTNFAEFPPLGVVLVAMLGVGVAESSGLLAVAIQQVVAVTSAWLVSPVIVLMGIMSSIATDVGYVVLIPLGAIVFLGFKRHPLAGIAAAFAGVSGGFSANLLITPLDPFFSGFSQSAAQLIEPNYTVDATANYYFMAVSTLMLTLVGWYVTDKIIEPRLPVIERDNDIASEQTTAIERRGLNWAGYSLLIFIACILGMLLPPEGVLREPTQLTIVPSPFLDGIVFFVALGFFIPGVVYGKVTGTMSTGKEIAEGMTNAMRSMAYFIALAFVAAQFTAYLSWSNLGTILAINGANLLENLGIGGFFLLLLFILLTIALNLIVSSAAKWAILAPVFVPMLMLSGFSPATAQVAFRIGDSATNIITPTMSYLPIILGFARKYDKQIDIGKLIMLMLPYAIAFLLGWLVLLVVWYVFDLPLGVGAGMFI